MTTPPGNPLLPRDRILAGLLGLHGLSLLVVFPLGPQEARLWQPGVHGAAALAAAFPFAAVLGGLFGLRMPSLPDRVGVLAWFAFLTTLPSLFSIGYDSLFVGRIISGFATGIGLVALHKLIPTKSKGAISHLATRVFTFGMPLCILAATLLDWRAAFALILGGQALVGVFARFDNNPPALIRETSRFVAPIMSTAGALVAAAALAFVTAAYLTVLSGFLLASAGRNEFYIPAGLLVGAILGLGILLSLRHLRLRLQPAARFNCTLATSALSLASLLLLRNPQPASVAIGLIGVFLATSGARQAALGELIASRVAPLDHLAHQSLQSYTPIAHHLGAGLGAFCAGGVIHVTSDRHLAGMPLLFVCGLGATGLAALAAGYASTTGVGQNPYSASPAARAAAANNPFRMATSLVRSVLTSNTRTPGSPT